MVARKKVMVLIKGLGAGGAEKLLSNQSHIWTGSLTTMK
jgi:hypothetical protein